MIIKEKVRNAIPIQKRTDVRIVQRDVQEWPGRNQRAKTIPGMRELRQTFKTAPK